MKALLLSTSNVEWLFNDQYFEFLVPAIINARKSIIVQQFIIDARSAVDTSGKVAFVLSLLRDAVQRNIHVKVLLAQISVPESDLLNRDLNEPAALFLDKHSVDVKYYECTQMHKKTVIVDEEVVLIGSHNWTPNSFGVNTETTMAIRSVQNAKLIVSDFSKLWLQAKGYGLSSYNS